MPTLVTLLFAGPDAASVSPQEARDVAQLKLAEGNRLVRGGNYREALEVYRQAYAMVPSTRLLFNFARCEDKLGESAAAVRDYAAFLHDVPALDEDGTIRSEAETRVRALSTALVMVELSGDVEKVSVTIDDGVRTEPIDRRMWLDPGPHTLVVARPGAVAFIASVTGAAGERIPIELPRRVAMVRDPAPPQPGPEPPAGTSMADSPPTSRPLYRRWWLWAGVGAVLAGVGAAFFLARRPDCPSATCVAPWPQ